MRALLALTAAVGLLAIPQTGHAFCRTTTCPLPAGFEPTDAASCLPRDFDATCAALSPPVKVMPLWWRSACVGYSLQKDGSRHVSFDAASNAAARAFASWTARTCPTTGTGPSRVSIDVRDLGPVACGEAGYNPYGANQHVIAFHDDAWPHKTPEELRAGTKSLTIALTTVNFDPGTGEIFDADIELNTADHVISTTAAPGPDSFDLQAVLTHETGHFLGLAHSPDRDAVMFFRDEGSDVKKRDLAADDVAGICSAYPADGTRVVGTAVAASGKLLAGACDPTPRHGFTSDCRHDSPPGGCRVGRATAAGAGGASGLVIAVAFLARRLARRRAVLARRRRVLRLPDASA